MTGCASSAWMDRHAHSSPGQLTEVGHPTTPRVVKGLKIQHRIHIVSKITNAALDVMLTQMRAEVGIASAIEHSRVLSSTRQMVDGDFVGNLCLPSAVCGRPLSPSNIYTSWLVPCGTFYHQVVVVLLPLVMVCPSECSSVCSSFRFPCVRRPPALPPLFYLSFLGFES